MTQKHGDQSLNSRPLEGLFTGSFSQGKPSGIVQIQYANGDSYKGTMVNWKRHGRGIYLSKDFRLEGTFKRGAVEASISFREGHKILSEIKKGLLTGESSIFFKNYSEYHGTVVSGRPHGQGTLSVPVD